MSEQSGADGGEKSHEPTPKKLQEARSKGDIPKSADVSTAASFLGLSLAFVLAGPDMVAGVGGVLAASLGRADELSRLLLGPGGASVAAELAVEIAVAAAPLFLLPFAAVVLSVAAQQAFTYAPDKLKPKISRISPLSVAKNKFGPSGLFEFAKSLVKLVVISIVMALFLRQNMDLILGSLQADGRGVAGLIGETLLRFLWLVFAIAVVISVGDYFWQAFDHKRKLRMSYQEIQDENKRSEGDPHLKQERRQRGYDIATQRMMAEVSTADVVVVNPQHFAVALKWQRDQNGAPVCVAKGVDEVAARIRARAGEASVPIHRDPPTARAIYAVVELGQEVHPEHYRPVAAAIRYAEKIRTFARKGARL